MKHNLYWHIQAWEDYLYWHQTDKAIFQKINELIKAIDREPFTGVGKPEPLKHGLKGFWSRRINLEHRIVYCVDNKMITITACRYHYDD